MEGKPLKKPSCSKSERIKMPGKSIGGLLRAAVTLVVAKKAVKEVVDFDKKLKKKLMRGK